MKRIITLLSVAVAFVFQVNAQTPTPKGTLFVGGGISYSNQTANRSITSGNTTTTRDLPSTSTFELSPTVGYMLTDNWAIGLGIGFGSTNVKSRDNNGDLDEENITRLTTLNPFVRYYYPLNDRVSVFGQGNIGFGFGSNEQIEYDNNSTTTTTTRSDVSTFDISIRPGINFFITDKIAVEGTIGRIGYSTTQISRDNFEENNNEFQFAITPREFSLGVFYWFK